MRIVIGLLIVLVIVIAGKDAGRTFNATACRQPDDVVVQGDGSQAPVNR